MFRHRWFGKDGLRYRQVLIDGGIYSEERDGVEIVRRSATPEEQEREDNAQLSVHERRMRRRRAAKLRQLVLGGGVGVAVLEVLLAYGVIPVKDAIAAGWQPPNTE